MKKTIYLLIVCCLGLATSQAQTQICAGLTTTISCTGSMITDFPGGLWKTTDSAVATVDASGGTPVVTAINAGNALISYTAVNCGNITFTYSVTVTGTPTITATAVNVSCYGGATGSITTTIAGGKAQYAYLWNTGATTAGLASLSLGAYSVTVTDANNCTSSASYILTQPAALILSAMKTNASCNGCSTGSIMTKLAGGTAPFTYAWSNNATTANLTAITAGNYTLTVTDAKSCATTGVFTITERVQPQAAGAPAAVAAEVAHQ